MSGPFREVDYTTRGTARLAKVLSVSLVLAGIVIVGQPFLSPMPWWTIPLMALAGLLVVVIGIGLWSSESGSASDTVRLMDEGVEARASVVDVEEIPDPETTSYRMSLRVAADGLEPIEVHHRCSKSVCLDAARQYESGQPVIMPAVLLPSTGEWMLTHR